jgi:hypothetical protein
MLQAASAIEPTAGVAGAVAALNSPRYGPYVLQLQRASHGDLWHAKRRLHDLAGAFAQWLSIPRDVISLDQRVVNGAGRIERSGGLPYTGYLFHIDLIGSIVIAMASDNRIGAVTAFDQDDDRIVECAPNFYDELHLTEPPNPNTLRAWIVCGPGVCIDRLNEVRDALRTKLGFPPTTVSIRRLGDDQGGIILDVKSSRLIAFGFASAARDDLLTEYDARNARLDRLWDSFEFS